MPDADAGELRLYAILRSDIQMSPGKAHAQTGHAYTDALLHALSQDNHRARAYARLRPGTKVCLSGGSHAEMLRLLDRLAASPLPHIAIIDSGHVEPPDFDGSPVLTAIGVGPLLRAEAPNFLKRLPLWTGPTLAVGPGSGARPHPPLPAGGRRAELMKGAP